MRYKPTSGGSWSAPATVAAGSSPYSYDVTGLTPETDYTFEVTAVGTGGSAAPVTTTATTAALAPAAPTALDTSSTPPTTTTITLKWSWSQGAGGSATGYKVRYRTTTGPGAWSGYQSVTPNTTKTKAVTGLTTGTSYDFEVVATGPGGDSTALTGSATTA